MSVGFLDRMLSPARKSIFSTVGQQRLVGEVRVSFLLIRTLLEGRSRVHSID